MPYAIAATQAAFTGLLKMGLFLLAERHRKMSVSSDLPGPKGQFLMGNLNEFNRDPLTFLLEQRQYGDISRFSFGPVSVIFVNHPDLIHDVLVTNADKYHKRSINKRIMGSVIGNGLVVSDGDYWKRQRRLMQPAFHTKRIGAYGEIMVNYADELAASWQDRTTRPIDEDMTALTMRIIAKTLFDADVTHEPPEVAEAGREAVALLEESARQLVPLPDWLPTAHNRKLNAVIERFDALIQRFIDDRRASGEDKGDFLSLLLTVQDEDSSFMTDKQVRDEAKTLFGAGHETTAVGMTWMWYLLAQYPEVEAKLHEELDRVLAGRLPTIEDLPLLTYTEKVVKESLRLYPPAMSIGRQVHEKVTLGGVELQAGQNLTISVYGIHRDARFYPEPDAFDPERFSPENEKSLLKYAYLPFGTGPRVCIGNAFSLMEARLLLATLAQRCSLSLAPDCIVEAERRFTLRPKNGLRMVINHRKPLPKN